MNKSLLMAITACAAMAMTSCSSEDLTGGATKANETPISFSTYLGRAPQSRGAITNDAAIKTADKGFGVFASLTSSTGWSETDKPNFMYKQQVTYVNTTWGYTPVKYWPNNEQKVSFFAYAPYNGAGVDFSGNNVAGAPTATIKLQEPDNMIDFVADKAMNQTYESTTDGKVNFTLKHEMTRVAFKASTTVADGTTITIKNITLKGTKLYKEGKYTFPTTGANGKWAGSANTDNSYSITLSPKKTLTNSSASADLYSYLFLIPVSGLAEGDVTATIEYDITTTDGALADGYVTTSATKEVKLTAGTLEQGKAYVFTFTIGLNDIKLSATVSDWATDTNANTTVTVPAN